MRLSIRALAVVVPVLAVVAGCSGDDDDDEGSSGLGSQLLETLDSVAVDTTGKVQAFSLGSAPNAFYQTYLPILTADLNLQFGDTCPTKTEDGNTTTYSGGCVDQDGQSWVGTAVQRAGSGGSSIEYDGFGFSTVTSCGGIGYTTGTEWNGGIEIEGMVAPGSDLAFETDLVVEFVSLDETTCAVGTQSWGVVYEGEMSEGTEDGDSDGEPDTQIFSGSGVIGVDVASGDISIEGKAEAFTVDEVVVTTFTSDTSFTLCQTEALSGETTYEGGGSTTVVTYDGDTDCDEDSTVTWTLNGTAQGEVSGVACSVARVGTNGAGFLALGGLLALVMARRRR